MSKNDRKPILVTGSHRSGSTWTGRMIAHASDVAYIHEPFNPQHRPGICKAKFCYQFSFICEENEFQYLNDLEDCLNFKYHLIEELKFSKSPKEIARSILNFSRFAKYRILKKRPLIKDPIAIFSAEWLAQRFNMDVVVLIRHPAAFAGSLKKKKWLHPFDHFLNQPLLMKHRLKKYEFEIKKHTINEQNITDQAILLWNMIHKTILDYKKNNPNWIFVKHEDLSRNPIEEFKNIYNRLGLNFSDDIKEKIEIFSFPQKLNKVEHKLKHKGQNWLEMLIGEHSHQFKLNSKSNIWSWKNRLSAKEVDKIRKNTNTIASKFYTQKDLDG